MAITANEIMVGDEVRVRTLRYLVTKVTPTHIHLDEYYKGSVVNQAIGKIEDNNPHLIRAEFYRNGVFVGFTDGRS